MLGKNFGKTSILCGVALLLILGFLLLDNKTPIALSKNALFKVHRSNKTLQVPGKVADAENGAFYQFHQGVLRKIDDGNHSYWERDLTGETLLWMGTEGILTRGKDSLKMWDKDNNMVFEKENFLDDIRVLNVSGSYWLFSGNLGKIRYIALMNNLGSTLWYIPVSETIISGSVTTSGVYTVINLIDEEVSGRMVLVSSSSAVLWEKTYPMLLLQTKALKDRIVIIAEDKAFALDYDGELLWEYSFEGAVLRGDIGEDGYVAVVLKENVGSLNIKDQTKIIMLSAEGSHLWSYGLDLDPTWIKKGKDFLYILDESGILVLSREGLLTSKIDYRGALGIEEVSGGNIIVFDESRSSLIEFSGGR